MAAINAAAAQAELMEKEKAIMEQQQKLQHLKSNLANMSNHQVALEREKRRSQITLTELSRLDAAHTVYKGIGRMFVVSSVTGLINDHSDREAKCGAETTRLSEEKKRLAGAIQKEEEQLQHTVSDFMGAVRMLQATQQLPANQN